MADIYSLDDYRKKHDMKRGSNSDEEALVEIEKSNKEFREQSHQAWENLKKNTRLSRADRVKIARRLYREVENLLRIKPGLKKWKICQKAGLTDKYAPTSQALSFLTLPADSNAKPRRLRSTRAPYRALIKAIADLSGENLFRLVDEITIGTEIHPLHEYVSDDVESTDSPDVLMATLHEAIDRIDRKFKIYESYNKTADVIAKRARKGSVISWPFTDYISTRPDEKDSINRKSIYWRNTHYPQFYARDTGEVAAIMNANALLAEESFLPYVPHVYLGTQYTFDWEITLTWDRYAWPYRDNCGEECRCEECKDAIPCLPWERGGCYGASRWISCLEREEGHSDRLRDEHEMGRRILSQLQEPLRFMQGGGVDGKINVLEDGRSLKEVYEAIRRERAAMFDERGQLIHPHQAAEYIRYIVKNPDEVNVSKEMLHEVSRIVESKYGGDYQRFATELENAPLKAEWKNEVQESISEMGWDLDYFGQFYPYSVWLVIYPDPELNGLVPAIYSCDMDGVGELIELNTRLYSQLMRGALNSSFLPSIEPIIGRDGRALEVVERIRDLVVGNDGFVIYEEWCRTAEFIKKNPVLQMIEDEGRRLKEFWEMEQDDDN